MAKLGALPPGNTSPPCRAGGAPAGQSPPRPGEGGPSEAEDRVGTAAAGKGSRVPEASYSAAFLSLSALPITDTDDRLIAAAAMIGDSVIPSEG